MANCSPNLSRTEVSSLCVSQSIPPHFSTPLKSRFDHLNGVQSLSNYAGMLAVLLQRPLGQEGSVFKDRRVAHLQEIAWFGVIFFSLNLSNGDPYLKALAFRCMHS